MEQIYNDISKYNDTPENIYISLCTKYNKSLVDFVMYDKFNYIPSNELLSIKHQRLDHKFTDDVKQRYNNKCIITQCPIYVCQVCHIKPFAECNYNEKYDINNGIILRNDLHCLFDKHLLKINPNTMYVELDKIILSDMTMNEYHKYNNMKVDIHTYSYRYLNIHYAVVLL